MTVEIPGFVAGWISDPVRVQESISEREASGQIVMGSAYAAANKPSMIGNWKRMVAAGTTGLFLRDAEVKILGRHRRPYYQKAGTCISRGSARGVQASLDYAIALGGSNLVDAEIGFPAIYSLARHEIGKDRCGSGDGAILADAMAAISKYGCATTSLFPGQSEDAVEKLAVKYAAPRVGTPSEWIAACKGHTCDTFCVDSLDLLFDCISAGYAVPYASGYVTGMPNKSGMSRLGSAGGHCRCFTFLYIDDNGDTQLGSSESWSAFPAASPDQKYTTCPVEEIPCITIKYAGGTKVCAPGDVGVDAKQFWSAIQSGGEAWAVAPVNYEAESMADLLKTPIVA